MSTSLPASMPVCPSVNEKVEVELQSAPVSVMSAVPPMAPHNPEPLTVHIPLLNGSRPNDPYSVPESQLDFDTEIIGDDLDDLIDSAAPSDPSLVSTQTKTQTTCHIIHTLRAVWK